MTALTTITAAPRFGAAITAEPRKSPFFYRQTQGDVNLGRMERIKAYGKAAHLKAGFNEAATWFKGKGTLGKIIAVGTLAGAWALDFVIAPFTAGLWTVGKLFFPNLNVSGLGRAFHYGVHKSYELTKDSGLIRQ